MLLAQQYTVVPLPHNNVNAGRYSERIRKIKRFTILKSQQRKNPLSKSKCWTRQLTGVVYRSFSSKLTGFHGSGSYGELAAHVWSLGEFQLDFRTNHYFTFRKVCSSKMINSQQEKIILYEVKQYHIQSNPFKSLAKRGNMFPKTNVARACFPNVSQFCHTESIVSSVYFVSKKHTQQKHFVFPRGMEAWQNEKNNNGNMFPACFWEHVSSFCRALRRTEKVSEFMWSLVSFGPIALSVIGRCLN